MPPACPATNRVSPMSYMKQREENLGQWMRDVVLQEVKVPGYLVGQAYGVEMSDAAMMDFMDTISKIGAPLGWVVPRGTVSFNGRAVTPEYLWATAESMQTRTAFSMGVLR